MAKKKKDPTKCPVCGSKDIEAHDIDTRDGVIIEEAACLECPADWQVLYSFYDIQDIRKNEDK